MIASLRGTCLAISGTDIVVEVGGVGLQVACTPSLVASARRGEEIYLATALVVREDGWTLFGFADDDERTMFQSLQTVTGVGPKMAAAAIGVLGAPGLSVALSRGDVATLVGVPGVGKKLADRMVLELKDKIVPLAGDVPAPAGMASPLTDGSQQWRASVVAGLLSLGWQQRDADGAVEVVAAAVVDEGLDIADIPMLLRRALSSLDRV